MSELAETSDANAVLILQPAVEAFFIVHGSDKDDVIDKDKRTESHDQTSSASSIDLPPFSPSSPGVPLSPSRQSSASVVSFDLPPDTQKFLRFAGEILHFFGHKMLYCPVRQQV